MKSPATLLLLAASCLMAPGQDVVTPTNTPAPRQYIYKIVNDRNLTIDVDYPPAWNAADKRPAIVFFFGGGWRGGTPNQLKPQSEYFAARSLVCLRVNYRVRSRDKVLPDKCVEDAISAMRWVRGHAAQLGVDPNRIVAAGASAGGHLAACTFLVEDINAPGDDKSISPKPNVLLLYNPVVDLTALHASGDSNLVAGLGMSVSRQISPSAHIRKDIPQTLVMAGTADRFHKQIQAFVDNSRALGAPVEATFTEGQPHGYFNRSPWLENTTETADAFLRRIGYLGDKPKVPLPTHKTASNLTEAD